MIRLVNITKDYKVGNKTLKSKTIRALENVNLEFKKNEFVSILGPSGCGKTTLLNIIGGLDEYSSGELFINDISTKKYKSKDWDTYRNHNVGFVFQTFNLIQHQSVLKNVELSLTLSGISKRERIKKAKEALIKVGLKKEIRKKPNQLSGGQMQRVAIARAIVNNPMIILADEPTGALDSKTSKQILDILKEISTYCLVIMVTHNEELANIYSTRIINLLDGKVTNDQEIDNSNNIENREEIENVVEVSKTKKKKTRMSFFTALGLSFKNLLTKWPRTILTVIAGSIGIIGVSLVLAVSDGVKVYIDNVQQTALRNYPIIVRSSTVISSTGSIYGKLPQFPDTDEVIIKQGTSIYEHISSIDDDFIKHIDKLDQELYDVIDYNSSITMNILHKDLTNNSYWKVLTYNFTEMTDRLDFVNQQYDCLYGKIPTEANEIALVVDKYNCISATMLYYLGLPYENVEKYTFDELTKNTFRLLDNNDYYTVYEDRYVRKGMSYYDDLYNTANLELKISGILRVKNNSDNDLYSSTILYTKKLTDYVLESASNSDIVKEQIEYGLNKNVLTGEPYEDSVGLSSTTTKEYLYENMLIDLAAVKEITTANIYTTKFEDRLKVEEYIKNYNKYSTLSNVSYYDYMSNVTKEFSTFISLLTKTLIIFALISLIVSSIMICVITYISVIERTKEIGILRSIGARRLDIGIVFSSECMLVGLASGVIGVVGSIILSNPITRIVKRIILNNTNLVSESSLKNAKVIIFNNTNLLLLVLLSVVLTMIAGLAPSISASLYSPIKSLRNE